MATRISPEFARTLFSYDAETGVLRWKERPVSHFSDESYARRWNKRFAGAIAGSPALNGYLRVRFADIYYLNHRLIWAMVYGRWPSDCIDHINGARADNRLENLREVDMQGNARNARLLSSNTSGVVGVSYARKEKRWHAYIGIGGGKRKTLGYFADIETATLARRSAELELEYHANHGRARG